MYCWVLMMAEFFNTVNVLREQMRLNIRAELDACARLAGPLTLATVASGSRGS